MSSSHHRSASQPIQNVSSPTANVPEGNASMHASSSEVDLTSLTPLERAKIRVRQNRERYASISTPQTSLYPGKIPFGANGGALLTGQRLSETGTKADIDYLAKDKESRGTPITATLNKPDDLLSPGATGNVESPQPRYRRQTLSGGALLSAASQEALRGLADATSHKNDNEADSEGIRTVEEGKRKQKRLKKKRRKRNIEEELEPKLKEDELHEIHAELIKDSPSTYAELTKWMSARDSDSILKERNRFYHPLEFDLTKIPAWQEFVHKFRDLEEEGLYVGAIAPTLPENLKTIARRLQIQETDYLKKWVDDSNQLSLLPDPLSYVHMRLISSDNGSLSPANAISSKRIQKNEDDDDHTIMEEIPERRENSMELVRVKALPSQYLASSIESPDKSYLLSINLAGLSFKDHPLMSEEIRMATELEELVKTYQTRKKSQIVEFLTNRLDALKSSYEDFVKTISRFEAASQLSLANLANSEADLYQARPARLATMTKIRQRNELERYKVANAEHEAKRFQYLKDIRATRLLRDTESQTDRILEYKIIRQWELIKELRLSQGFSSSPVRLRLILADTVPEEANDLLKEDIDNEIEELKEILKLENARQDAVYRKQIKEWTLRKEAFRQKYESASLLDKSLRNNANEFKDDVEDGDMEELPRLADVDSASEMMESSTKRTVSRKTKKALEGPSETDDTLSPNSPKSRKTTKVPPLILEATSSQDEHAEGKATHSESAPEEVPNGKKLKAPKLKKLTKRLPHVFDEPKPLKPTHKTFNEQKVRHHVIKRRKASVRQAGTPIFDFVIDKKSQISDTTSCPKLEQSRRLQVEYVYVYMKLFFNDHEVMRTVARPLDHSTFSMKFTGPEDIASAEQDLKAPSKFHGGDITSSSVSFMIKILENPVSLRAEFYEAGTFGDTFLAEVYIPFPGASDAAAALDRELSIHQFTGKPFSPIYSSDIKSAKTSSREGISASGEIERWVSGDLFLRVSWGIDDDGVIRGPNSQQLRNRGLQKMSDPLAIDGPPGLLSLPKLMEWILDMPVDPNDPRNNEIMELKRLAHSVGDMSSGDLDPASIRSYWNSRKTYRHGLPKWLYDETLGLLLKIQSIRHEILRLRYNREIFFNGPVPFNDTDITPDLYERIVDPSKSKHIAAESLVKTSSFGIKEGVEDMKSIEMGFLKRVRAYQLKRQAKMSRPTSVNDHVREAKFEYLSRQRSTFDLLFKSNRPLNPYRSNRTQYATSCPDSCKIVVQVLRGYNIPVRKTSELLIRSIGSGGDGNTKTGELCNPFVEVTFQFRKARTACASGSNPLWNETLSLDVNAPQDDFSPEALIDSGIGTEMVFINVFDELVVDLLEDNRERDTTIHQRKEKAWLGGIQIPFSTIWESLRIDGEFNLKMPRNLLGYDLNPSSSGDIVIGSSTKGTGLHLFITMDPPLLPPPPLTLKFQSKEKTEILKYANHWCKSLLSFKRVVMVTTLDTSGNTTLVNRFITPQIPPVPFTSIHQIRRFVSMIPYLPNSAAFGGDCSFWATTQEVFDAGAADGIEHALILCNYLIGLQYTAWVVLGRGIPEGTTAYVLVQNSAAPTAPVSKKSNNASNDVLRGSSILSPYTLYHPVTGEEFNQYSQQLPLKEVGCVFNNENIWANVQKESLPSKITFNISDPKSWKPFFGGQLPYPTDVQSIQNKEVQLQETTSQFLLALETAMEKKIIQKFEEWRSGRVTRWNRMCSRVFKNLMTRFESDVIADIPISEKMAAAPELVSINNVYKTTGFPINLPYTDIAAACAAVHSTAVHTNLSVGVEFALAVHCHGYPGRFVSVWIFIASLVRQ